MLDWLVQIFKVSDNYFNKIEETQEITQSDEEFMLDWRHVAELLRKM